LIKANRKGKIGKSWFVVFFLFLSNDLSINKWWWWWW